MTRLSYWVFSLIDLEKLLLLTCHFLYLSDTTGVFTRCILKESAIILCTRSITTGDFTRCVLNESAVRLCTRSITTGYFTRCVLLNECAVRLRTRSIFGHRFYISAREHVRMLL